MAQAQKQAQGLQEKLAQRVVEASAGGGSVTVSMNGQKVLRSITIDPEVVKSGDVEMLQDQIVAAVNEAGRKVDQEMQTSLGGMLGNLGLVL